MKLTERWVAWAWPKSLLVDDVLTMRDERDEAKRRMRNAQARESECHKRAERLCGSLTDALEAERAKGAELAALVVDLAATLDALMGVDDTAPREQAGGGGMGHRYGPQGENRNG